jgi:DNA-binding XRE family transcriptional regulator
VKEILYNVIGGDICMIAERLIKLRKDRSMTHTDLAKILGIERTTYGKYETRGIQPPIEVILKLAEHYDVTTDYLLGIDKKQSCGVLISGAVVNGHNSGSVSVTNGGDETSRVLSKEEQEMLRIYSVLDVKSRMKMLDGILKIEEEFIKNQNA